MTNYWIKYKNGSFGGIYEGDEIRWPRKDKEDIVLDLNTDDQILFTYGILRLKKEEPAFPNRPHQKRGPIYRFVNDGKAEVTETWDYIYDSFDDIKRSKVDEWFWKKDTITERGVTFNGRKFDCRYRNICHLAVLASLIPVDEYPKDFEWFDADGNTFLLPKEDCIGLLKATALTIKNLETEAMKEYKYINSIKDIDELLAYKVTPNFENH